MGARSRRAWVRLATATAAVFALTLGVVVDDPGVAHAVAASTLVSTDNYAYSPKQVYDYKIVMPVGGTLRNIHVGLPDFATLASDSTLSTPSLPTGRVVKYSGFYDFFPSKPTLVGAGWTLYFQITGAINPRPATVSALIEAWNSSGARYASFRIDQQPYPLAPAPRYPATRSHPVTDAPCTPTPYSVTAENLLPGGTGWRLTNPSSDSAPQIEAYADRTSATCGQTFGVHVNVTDGSPTFTTEIWRHGWYGGDRGRLIATLGPTEATKQLNRVLQSLERASDNVTPTRQNPRIATTAKGWSTSYQVTVPPEWTPGVYLFKLTSSTGFQTYIPFVVRDDSSQATYMLAIASMTYQAYSTWGGASLYSGISGQEYDQAVVVSFDRPYGGVGRSSAGNFLYQDARLVSEFERRGLRTTYISDDNLAVSGFLARHETLVLGPHLEYWTAEMRSNVDRRVAAGMNVLNFGANQAWWQVDLRNGRPSGLPRRSVHTSRACAPDHTGYFHDTARGCYGSSQALFGVQYNCWGTGGDAVAADNWLWAGTGLQPGAKLLGMLGGGTGTETDVVGKGQPTPAGLTVLAHSPLSLCHNVAADAVGKYSDMVYYRDAAGGQVFSAGTQSWVCFLDSACAPNDQSPIVLKMMDNLLARFSSSSPPAPSTASLAEQYGALPHATARAIAPWPFCRPDQSAQDGCVERLATP